MSSSEKQKTKRPQDITSLEREKRVNEVHTLILQGATSSQIIEYCRQNFQVERASSYFYIAEAKKTIIENFEKTFDKDAFKAEIYARLENLYQQNMDVDDFKECRNILKDIRDMLGLNSISKIDLTTNGKEIQQNISILNIDPLAINEQADDSDKEN